MKKAWMSFIALLLVTPLVAEAFPPDKTGKNCVDCHKLERKEAEAVIKKLKDAGSMPPNVEVREVKLAPVGGVWQIDLEANGQRGSVFVDFSKKFLLPQIVPIEAIKKPEPRKIDFSKISLGDAVVLGAKSPKKKVAVFTDPDCPYCRRLHEAMKEVIAKRQDVAFYLIMFPLPMHKDAYKKSQAVLCEKSLELLDDAFSGKAMPEPKCTNEALERSLALGREHKIEGTPALVREDGTFLGGYLPADKLTEWIDAK